MSKQTALAALGVFIFCVVILLGCSPTIGGCFVPIGINPANGNAVTFDGCKGVYHVQTSTPSTTTTTTISKMAF